MTKWVVHTNSLRKLIACGLLLLSIASAPSSHAAIKTDKKEIIRQARLASYSLRRLGLLEFSAKIKPNWEVILKEQMKTNPSGAQAGMKLLTGLHFALTLDQHGKVKVTHQTDEAAQNETVAAGFNKIFDGMDQLMSGFFDTWSIFMLTSAFPDEDSDYRLENLGDRYRLSYKEGDASIVTEMTRDFLITDSVISAADFKSSIRPQVSKTRQGFVLTGYEANYTPTSGPGKTHLKVHIDYQEVSSLQLPGKLNIDGDFDGALFATEVVFTDYQVKLH